MGFSLIETKTFVARKNLINSANSRHSVEFELFSSFNVCFLRYREWEKVLLFFFLLFFFCSCYYHSDSLRVNGWLNVCSDVLPTLDALVFEC